MYFYVTSNEKLLKKKNNTVFLVFRNSKLKKCLFFVSQKQDLFWTFSFDFSN